MPAPVWKLLSVAFRFLALPVVDKALLVSWKAVTGREAPEEPESPDVSPVEAVVFAAISGALVAVVRTLATRQVAIWTAGKGKELPEDMQRPYTGDSTRPRRRR